MNDGGKGTGGEGRAGEVTFVELCRQFGVSRKTGYKRVERFQSYSWEGLGDWSRAPRRHPNSTLRAVAERVIAARRVHPTWGPKKLMAWLRDLEPEMSWPAPSTAGEILDRAGGWYGGNDVVMLRPGASPLPQRRAPTTCGRSTSRGGSARGMGSG